MRGCHTNEVKNGEMGKIFLRRKLDASALSETKLKGRGEVVGRVSGMVGGKAREGVAISPSELLLRCVVEWKVSSRVMYVKVKIERESWVLISAYGPGSERSEEEIEFWGELRECVGSFGRNESVVVLRDLNARVEN